MASQIGSLSIDLEAKLSKFESDMGRAARIAAKEMERMRASVNKQLQAVNDQMSGFANKAGIALKGLVTVLSARELTQFAKRSIDVADSINDLSKKFGISTQAISAWRLVAEKSGSSLEGITRAAKFLVKDIEKSDFYLKQIGISMTDLTGKSRPVESVIADIAQKFSGFEYGAEKASLAAELFGKGGADLIPFLNDFGQNLENANQKAKDFGAIVTQDLASASDQFNDNLRDMSALSEGFANSMLSSLLPSLNSYIELQLEASRQSKGFTEAGKEVGDALKNISLAFIVAKNALDIFVGAISFLVKSAVAQFFAAQQAIQAFSDFTIEAGKALLNPFDDNTLELAKGKFLLKIGEIGSGMVDAFKESSSEFGESIFANIEDVEKAFDTFSSNTESSINKTANAVQVAVPKIKTLAEANKEIAASSEEAKKALSEWTKLQKQHDAEMIKAEEIMIKHDQALIDLDATINEIIASYDDEIKLISTSENKREDLAIRLKAEENIRNILAQAVKNGINLSDQEVSSIENEIRARSEALIIAKKQAEIANEFQRSWENSINSVNDVFADFLSGGIRDFEEFGDSLSRISQRFFSDIIKQTIRAGDGFAGLSSRLNQSSMFGPGGTGFTAQGAASALGAAYGGYQAYRQGNTIGTVLGGAQAGASLFGTTGAIVGGIIGGLASLFRSNKPPDIRVGGVGAGVRKPEEQFQTALGGFQIGTRQIERTPIIQALQQFDGMIGQMLQTANVSAEQMQRIRDSLQSVVLDLRGGSATAENVIRSRFDAILNTFDAATQAYVRAGSDIQEQVQRLGEHLQFPQQLQDLIAELSEQDRLSTMSSLQQQIYQMNKQFDEMIERATFLGATQEQLAQIENYRANALSRLSEVENVETIDQYANAIAELNAEFLRISGGAGSSQLIASLSEIRREEAQRISTLNRLARESGRTGAAEEDLITVHRIAAARAAQAISQMRAAAASLVQQLYGNRASTQTPAQSAAASLDATAQDLFAGWESALESIRGFLDSILLDEGLTVLTPQQQLAEAQNQFNNLLNAANAGDAEAAQQLPELARQLLDNARSFYASGQSYDAIFNSVMSGLRSVSGLGVVTPNVGGTGTQEAITQAELAAEDVEQQRLLMAVELAGYIRELADAMGESVFDLTEELGVNLNEFVTDLGVDVTNMTMSTAQQLADIAGMLGVELPQLASELGISLGQLREANSMLNDALEDAINDQPPEIADELRPLLSAVENAVNESDANFALNNLNNAVNRIGGATATALAPYLENVDPPSASSQIYYLDSLWNLNRDYLPQIETWLEEIANSVRRDSGITRPATVQSIIPENMQSNITDYNHQIDSRYNSTVSEMGVNNNSQNKSSLDNETKSLLRDLLQKVNESNQRSTRRDERMIVAVEKLAFAGGRGK